MWKHYALSLAVVVLGASGLSACSDDGGTPITTASASPSSSATMPSSKDDVVKGEIEATCTGVAQWTAISDMEPGINVERLAKRLGVPVDSAAKGRIGPATCGTPIKHDRITSINPPVVRVIGRGEHCMVIGTDNRPVPGGASNKILAICAADRTTPPTA